MQTIKIRCKEYKIEQGDYIQFNGTVYLFCTGDGRKIRWKGHDSFDYVQVPYSVILKMGIKSMKEKKVITTMGVNVTRYYF